MEFINGKRIVPIEELEELGYGIIYDGGLVIGRKHSDGGIDVVFPLNSEYKLFEWNMNIEGGEFIMNSYATILYKERLQEINSYLDKEEYITEKENDLLEGIDGIIYIGNTDRVVVSAMPTITVINHSATRKYLHELIEMNNRAKEEYIKTHQQVSS